MFSFAQRLETIRRIGLVLMRRVNVEYYITQHGRRHVLRVGRYAEMLIQLSDLNDEEKFMLMCALWLHDIGQTRWDVTAKQSRDNHHFYGANMVVALVELGILPLTRREAKIVAELVYRHNMKTELPTDPWLRKLTSFLRAANVSDITKARVRCNDRGETLTQVEARIHREDPHMLSQRDHWRGHFAILALSITGTPTHEVKFGVSVRDEKAATFQIGRLAEKLTGLYEYFDNVEVKAQLAV